MENEELKEEIKAEEMKEEKAAKKKTNKKQEEIIGYALRFFDFSLVFSRKNY